MELALLNPTGMVAARRKMLPANRVESAMQFTELFTSDGCTATTSIGK
jgi:hypothetical protein